MRYTCRLALGACAWLLTACGDGDGRLASSGNMRVYADRESRQCEYDGVTPIASARKLVEAGIDVLSSTCGYRTGVAYPTVCGGPTGEIIVHEIRTVNLADAEALGFLDVVTLVDVASGAGYALTDCASRTPVTGTPQAPF